MRLKKIKQEQIHIKSLRSFSVIGDPGCEGLGTVMLQTYASALKAASEDDMILVAGDLVPIGNEKYYKIISDLTNTIAERDVYALKGNHDTGDYQEVLGLENYVIESEAFSIVVMDNAFRSFSKQGLELLEKTLKQDAVKQVVIAFHIPVPNHFTGNTVSEKEFQRLRQVYLPYKEKIAYLLCGHVHSGFEDIVDNIPLICTGGGGALIEDVSEKIRACDVDYHIVRFGLKNGKLYHKFVELSSIPYKKETADPIIEAQLEETVKGELVAHLRYLTFADDARRRGYEKIANLFTALAESEYRHARCFYTILEKPKPFDERAEAFIPGERFEYEKMYPMMAEYAKEHQASLTNQAYRHAMAAEKVHAALLNRAKDVEEFDVDQIYVCPICGFLMEEEEDRCPVCGSPSRMFEEFQA